MAELKGTMVEFTTNGRLTQGYLSKPENGTGTGIIILQEWWGLVGHIKKVADRFAASGYVALAPDLYKGESTSSPDDAGKLMMALNIEETEQDLRAAVNYLSSESNGTKVGVVGFCMGGQLALFATSKNEQIGACVDFYGIHPNVTPDYTNIKSPVLGLFAENDGFVTLENVRTLEGKLQEAGVATNFHIYPDVDHAFFNDEREVYNLTAATDAWERVQGFLSEHV